jgi:hypothetical protein
MFERYTNDRMLSSVGGVSPGAPRGDVHDAIRAKEAGRGMDAARELVRAGPSKE